MPLKTNYKDLLRPGLLAALTLKPGTAPLRCYAGKVRSVTEFGVRITFIDWLTGETDKYDFVAFWSQILSAIVEAPDSDRRFIDCAATWQQDCKRLPLDPQPS